MRSAYGWLVRTGFLVALAIAGGCNSATNPALQLPSMSCAGGVLTPDVVTSVCGSRLDSTVQQVSVTLGGPTTTNDFHHFRFELLYDPTHMSYVDGSAQAGNLLAQGGHLVPLSATEPTGAGHLVVTIGRLDSDPGAAWSGDANHVIWLTFRVVTSPTFGPSAITFRNGVAFDSTGLPIPSVTFSDGVKLSYQ